MPAVDSGTFPSKVHIVDRNKKHPIKTLCGQDIFKVRYWSAEENFEKSDCKTCRKFFFGDEA